MNIFYAPPEQIKENIIELRGQEAVHASKALRYSRGDDITVVDGEGGWYEGKVQFAEDSMLRVVIDTAATPNKPQPDVILGMGIIKKRDRLEFAAEKAVELGVKAIALFRGDHSIKQNARIDRLEAIVLSAMKQSLRSWLPAISMDNSMEEVLKRYNKSSCKIIAAHEDEKEMVYRQDAKPPQTAVDTLFLIGPEGGFSDNEMMNLKEEGADVISLGPSRLRSETAAVTILSQYHYSRL
jgi:16S rRNA (uracil1498-N3)-methyltransferase